MQPVRDAKESVCPYDLFDGNPLLVRPVPDEKICFPLTSCGVNFDSDKSGRNLLNLLNNIPVLFDDSFHFDLCREILAGKIMTPIVQNKMIVSASDKFELRYHQSCSHASEY